MVQDFLQHLNIDEDCVRLFPLFPFSKDIDDIPKACQVSTGGFMCQERQWQLKKHGMFILYHLSTSGSNLKAKHGEISSY